MNLRPLLNSIRKIFFINKRRSRRLPFSITSKYRGGKSTRDIIWVRKYIAAKAKKHQRLMVHIIGMEMCLVFDTFNRNDLIQELETFLDEGDCGMSQLLVSNN